jgi:hypothetical protein
MSQDVSNLDLPKESWEKIKEIYKRNNVAEILLT